MLNFQFLPTYIKNKEFDKNDLRIAFVEVPCQNPDEEEYRFRIKMRHKEEEIIIHRDMAIEHHLPRDTHPHNAKHLQFKFHTEGFGKIRITLDINNEEEYKSCILGFLSILKDLINNYEKYCKGITGEILNVPMFANLEGHRSFLESKVAEAHLSSRIEMETNEGIKIVDKELLESFRKNEALLPFLKKLVEQ